MAFVPVPNTVAVDVIYDWDGQIVENTLYYTLGSATPNLADITELLEAVNGIIRAGLLPLMSNAISLLRLVGTLIEVADGLQYISTTGLPEAGASDAESMPNNIAACISLRTGQSGRSFRGRNYVPGLTIENIDGNNLNSSTMSAIAAVYEGLIEPVPASAWRQTIVSRYTAGAPRTTGIATPVVNALFVDSVVDSQRRRLPGRGR